MGTYKNDYNKKDDPMMWELHEIRHKLAKKRRSVEEINKAGDEVIKKYGLKFKKVKFQSVKA